MQIKYQDSDASFFIKCSCLLENFNNIADINFAKHVSLNENSHINFDLFNLGDHIFINAVNEDIDHATFYRDVNPIQCKNIINNHMGINVASLFENLIPSQEKIIMKLNETQNEYQSNIDKLEDEYEKVRDKTREELDKAQDDKETFHPETIKSSSLINPSGNETPQLKRFSNDYLKKDDNLKKKYDDDEDDDDPDFDDDEDFGDDED